MMMMMMMTMENVVDDDDDDDVMTTMAKQSSSKISKKKKKRTTLLFLAIYQSVVSLRRDVFLRLSVSLSVCKSAFIIRASPWSGERFFGGRNFFKTT
jgi:flagellar biosynthesis protein FliP